jgi:replicative DNA helicase
MSQLSRQVENRVGNKPQLSDLRESGAIEQDADIVMFIYRPEYYHIDEDAKGSTAGMADIIIAKHRSGATDEVRLRFVKEYARFDNPVIEGLGELSIGGGMQPNSAFDQGGSMIIDSKMNDDNFPTDPDEPF